MNGVRPCHPLLTMRERRRTSVPTPLALESRLSQNVTRLDLRTPPTVGEPACAHLGSGTDCRAIHLEHRKPDGVHGFKRQRFLKPGFGRGLEPASVLQRPLAVQARPVALETERTPTDGTTGLNRLLSSLPGHPTAAVRTQRPRRHSFQFAAWESKPFCISSLQNFVNRCPHGIAV
jgi:hypothetical protein